MVNTTSAQAPGAVKPGWTTTEFYQPASHVVGCAESLAAARRVAAPTRKTGKVNGLSVLEVKGQYSLGGGDILDV